MIIRSNALPIVESLKLLAGEQGRDTAQLPEDNAMRRDWLRDAMDSYKDDVLRAAFSDREKAGRQLYVFPMRTDAPWGEEDWELYARIVLGDEGRVDRVLHREMEFSNVGRAAYFGNDGGAAAWPPPSHDFFLDPDTGIQTPWNTAGTEHVKFSDVERLRPADSEAVVAVYQHKFNSNVDGGLRGIGYVEDVIGRCPVGMNCLGVYGGSVSIIFFARDGEGLRGIRQNLNSLLGSVAGDRIKP
jgi:hypothetical protein